MPPRKHSLPPLLCRESALKAQLLMAPPASLLWSIYSHLLHLYLRSHIPYWLKSCSMRCRSLPLSHNSAVLVQKLRLKITLAAVSIFWCIEIAIHNGKVTLTCTPSFIYPYRSPHHLSWLTTCSNFRYHLFLPFLPRIMETPILIMPQYLLDRTLI
jgi:hypothetical protein